VRKESLTGNELTLARSLVLCPLFLLWANVHPSFFFGFFVLFASGLQRFVLKPTLQTSLRESLILVVAIAATCINPYGIALHTSILSLGASTYFMNLNTEWLPTDLQEYEGFLLLLGTALFVAWIWGKRSLRTFKQHGYTLISGALFLVLAYRSARTLPHCGIALSFPIASLLTTTIATIKAKIHRPWRFPFQMLFEIEERSSSRGMRGYSAALIVLLVGFLMTGKLPLTSDLAYGPQPSQLPIEIVRRLKKEAGTSGERYVIAASPDFGGTITFYGAPQVRALIDDRNTLLGEQFYREILKALQTPEDHSFLASLGATHILKRRESKEEKEGEPSFELQSLSETTQRLSTEPLTY
jgi:hypothetical protein